MATDRNVKVRLDADPKGFVAGMKVAGAALHDLRKNIDTTNDRTAWLAQSFLALGPTLTPLGATAAAGLAGLATQMTVAGGAAAVLTLAFNGVGDALKALNNYQLDPTEEHLKKLQQEMQKIGPSGRELVRELDKVGDGLRDLAFLSRDNMFPGVIDGLHEMETLIPQVQQIVAKFSTTLGDIFARGGEALAGDRFAEFFDLLEGDGPRILDQMARTIGNIADGFGAMLVAFAPLSRDFSGGMLEMSRAFADWAHGLRESDDFQAFVDYIRTSTPVVLNLIGQIADTFVQIVEAAAPIGPVLIDKVFVPLLQVISAIADSPLGPIFVTAAAAMSLYGRAAALASITTGGLGGKLVQTVLGFKKVEAESARAALAVQRSGAQMEVAMTRANGSVANYSGSLKRAAGGIGLFSLALSPLPEKIGLTNAATGALIGSFGGPFGAAIGGAAGGLVDLSKAIFSAMSSTREFKGDMEGLAATLDQQTGAITKNTEAFVENELAKQGVIAAARDIGIASDMLIDAYLGDELAVYRVEQALNRVNQAFYDSEGRITVSADTLDEYRGNLELVDSALGNGKGALDAARDSLILTGNEVDTTSEKFRVAKEKVDLFKEAVTDLDSALDKRAGFRTYQAAIDELAHSLRDNKLFGDGVAFNTSGAKGRENQANLDAFVQAVKDYAGTLDGVARKEFLRNALDQFDRLTGKAGLSKERAKELKRELGLLALVKATPTVKVGNLELSQQKVDSLERGLRNLDGITARPKIVLGLARDTGANFGAGPGFAGGGYTGPGGKYEPAGIVHRKEFVFSSEATQGNVAMLTKLHNHLRGYASGGYVTAAPAASPAPVALDFDYDRLAALRPLYGNPVINGDPTTWRKRMEDDARAAGAGKLGGY